jgi:hypothetical protein
MRVAWFVASWLCVTSARAEPLTLPPAAVMDLRVADTSLRIVDKNRHLAPAEIQTAEPPSAAESNPVARAGPTQTAGSNGTARTPRFRRRVPMT